MKIKELPNHSRPREKLIEKGAQSLKTNELLAILLRTGYQGKSALEIASRILKRYSIEELFNLEFSKLAKIKGVGKSRAALILSSSELNSRLENKTNNCTIDSPEDVVKVVHFISNKKKEYLVALYLNARAEQIEKQTISIGTLNESLVHPREIFAPAIINHASQVVIAHNHPSNNPNPSSEDIQITKRIKEAGEILGIQLTDHIIITNDSFFSFRKNKLLV